MKFGNLARQNTNGSDTTITVVNIGDDLQLMIIDYLYSQLQVNTSDVVKLELRELKDYQGEDVILPLNWSLFDSFFMNGDRIAISDKIIPVFLSMTIQTTFYKETLFNKYNIEYLKRYEPIGCRDAYTMNMLRKYHIRAYLNGCLTSVFPKRQNLNQNKVFFVDVPVELLPYIPDELEGNYETMTQQYYFVQGTPIETILDAVKAQYRKYADEARLVVTSRLHVASPCMAMGIPVIFVKNQIDARFGWLDKYLPLYNREHYGQIDWNPNPIEYEDTKELLIHNAIERILGVYETYARARAVEAVYENREKREYINFQQTIYNNFEKAIYFLQDNYSREDKFLYSIWGINNAAENFYAFMNREYPNAQLKSVIDKYKTTEFHGIPTMKPDDYIREDNEIIFVLPVKASNEASSVFAKKGIDSKYYVCCGEQFIGFDIGRGV